LKGLKNKLKKITVVGTGYVGLVTGVCFAEIGHHMTCIDIDHRKVEKLNSGKSPIFEPGLEDLMIKNINEGRLSFTTDHSKGFSKAEIIYIAVGTPQNEDGSANLHYVEEVAKQIATHLKQDAIIVTKSTVPVGTNDRIRELIQANLVENVHYDVVSNPEFLREGSAVHDTFYGDRIIIGTDSEHASKIMEEINKPFGIPIFKTDIRSAEMIKYASNAFLATKISFINEISTVCEKVRANIEDVSIGMGKDSRIGNQFLKAGIGYGGSCFPKDTKALLKMSRDVGYPFQILESVIDVNNKQQVILVDKAKQRFRSLQGKKCAILGLAFKPGTDDFREAPSIAISEKLIKEGAKVFAYDPVAMENAKKVMDPEVQLCNSIEAAIQGADVVFIVTEWKEFIDFPLNKFVDLMKKPIIYDGRNCLLIDEVKKYPIEYHSIGRFSADNKK
jgi:UDPglucose 6-dehydrogenase